ncbi:MAG: hypothetical protein DRI24_19845 [Deltaproteobacteria bacterium]|nr:MAG: hypothetical protein DRI24_19845 [Deltaproteobacteria bacterium]
MTTEPVTSKKNFTENDLIGLFDEKVTPNDFKWFSSDFFRSELSLASADSTIHVVRIYLKVFALSATREGKPLFTRSIPYPIDNRKKIANSLLESGFKLMGEHLDDHVFATDDTIVSLFDNGYMNSFSTSPVANEEVFTSLNELFTVKEEVINRAYVLEQSGGGFEFRPYKIKERVLIEENYMPEVVANLPRLYSVVDGEDPFGRLAILEGRPGGGKTSLIRGMMNEFGRPKFVIIPPYLVAHLNSPSMISSLVREQSNDPRPLVLVLEDADQCIATRMGDNISNISAVLNLAEGILSDTLDIRIVATTNAKRTELDEALTRPGRLGAYVEVPYLDTDQASKVLTRLCGKMGLEEAKSIMERGSYDGKSFENITLADVYAIAAKENGTYEQVLVPNTQRSVGFN